MRPVPQTIYGEGKGNCFSACVASILHIELDELAAFHAKYIETWREWQQLCEQERDEILQDNFGVAPWFMALNRELRKRGRQAAWVYPSTTYAPAGYSIAMGVSSRGYGHSCVALGGRVVWDPNTREGNGLTGVEGWVIFLPSVPWDNDLESIAFEHKEHRT